MSRAGFVLVGGRSSRMGRDKALLANRGAPLAASIAREVERAAGSATLIGPPERYGGLGWPVLADLRSGCGPLAGVETALATGQAQWNLIVACDMPNLSAEFLGDLLDRAERADADCLLPSAVGAQPEPLCAVWHARCLVDVRGALNSGQRRMTDALDRLRAVVWPRESGAWAANCNTPADWRQHVEKTPHE